MNKLSLILGASAVLLTGCSNPKFLVADYFIPDTAKVVRATLQVDQVIDVGNDTVNTYAYAMQVCDLSDGVASNCKTTTVLSNVLGFRTNASGGQ